MRRLGWGAADQAVSSLTNFALAVLVARSVGPRSFGAFAVVMSVYALALGAARAVVGEPLGIRHSSTPAVEERRTVADATGAALVVGAVLGLLILAGVAAVPGAAALSLLPLALALPGLLVQDAWRFAFVATGRPRRAFVNDALWAVGQLGTVGLLVRGGGASVDALVLAWGASATVAAVMGCAQARVVPDPRAARRWLHRHRDLWPRLGVEFGAMTGAWQLVMFLTGAIAGLTALGSIRAAQTLLGPLNLAFLTVPLVAVPELSRLRASPRAVLRSAAAIGAGLAVSAFVGGFLLWLMPSDLGETLLGASYAPGRALLVPMTVFLATTGLNIGAVAALRALGAVDRSLRTRLLLVPALVAAGAGGAVAGGAFGAASALAAVNGVASIVWWRQARQAAGERSGGGR